MVSRPRTLISSRILDFVRAAGIYGRQRLDGLSQPVRGGRPVVVPFAAFETFREGRRLAAARRAERNGGGPPSGMATAAHPAAAIEDVKGLS